MKTILIADDALFMRMMLKDLLTKNDFEVIGEVENGEEVVEAYKNLKPDIVLIDILMPVMDGLTATQKILELDTKAKVVLISALGQKAYMDKAKEMGVRSFIIKPFSPPKIIETLNEVLQE